MQGSASKRPASMCAEVRLRVVDVSWPLAIASCQRYHDLRFSNSVRALASAGGFNASQVLAPGRSPRLRCMCSRNFTRVHPIRQEGVCFVAQSARGEIQC